MEWLQAQLRKAFPGDAPLPQRLLFDRDPLFGAVKDYVRSLGIRPHLIGYRCPWQNGVVERFNGTLRRELLDHVIVRDEAHLHCLLKEFTRYYREDRTHLGLAKDTPRGRPHQPRPGPEARIASLPRPGGLHHRYEWEKTA